MPKKKKKPWIVRHFSKLGFTNRLCIYSLFFLSGSIVLGFILAIMSIRANANFTLAAYTCSVAPIGTFISIAIGKAVDKSAKENTSGGLKYEMALANFAAANSNTTSQEDTDQGDAPTI